MIETPGFYKHHTPKTLSSTMRSACAMRGSYLTVQLEAAFPSHAHTTKSSEDIG
jgi:hypothetical protein